MNETINTRSGSGGQPVPEASDDDAHPTDVEVLIVGAGPAGLVLACDLQRRDVRHRIVSAAAGGFEGSRAKGVQPRTCEVLDDLGALADIEAHSTLYPKLGIHLGPVTLPKTMIKHHAASEDVPHPNTLLVAQYDTDAALRRRLAELGGGVHHGVRLVGHSQEDRGVLADLEHADGRLERVRARYLVGADGGGSTVRSGAGIEFPGTTDESDRMVVADLTLSGLSRNRWHIWPRHAGRFMALCPLPDGRFQLMLKLRPDESADVDQATVRRMVEDFVGKADIAIEEVHWSSVWRPNIRLARRYRHGDVLLVGDAAHVHPPTGAQGMNTGIQDAYNLGWKLAQVLAGAPDALLDSYETERQPVAARVLGLSSEIYASMSSRPLAGASRGDEERQLRLSYKGGPLAGKGAATGRLVAGDRAPDAVYVDDRGRHGRLHRAFRGPHFTLLALGAEAGAAVAGLDFPRAGAQVVTVLVPEPSSALRSVYGMPGSGLVLVRPDGYIGVVAPTPLPGSKSGDEAWTAVQHFLALVSPPSVR
ncbi:FAD-dependent monooxygenase [Phycicoccus flavus]|uniref:FAD-dependent monooxygenase n=1 Tax=Phycicoccus flavus TaxID=2502783 RepID=UPI000FEB5D66|nr:FAD-dependent monooxygenase [Phycicoccus flavus]NHA68617.1 FAD-binding monooxygenase [Phycicoccus flavus]NHA68684.1 FAD-binding monooxygenase [Phycicoccus flavus]